MSKPAQKVITFKRTDDSQRCAKANEFYERPDGSIIKHRSIQPTFAKYYIYKRMTND